MVLFNAPSSFTILSPFSSTYFSGSMSSLNIFSNTSFATLEFIEPASTSSISFARFSGEKLMSSGSIELSFKRRIVSTMSQLETFLGLLQIAVVASKMSAILFELVIISASYSGISNSALYLALFSSLNSGWRAFTALSHSSSMTTGTRSGSGKYL